MLRLWHCVRRNTEEEEEDEEEEILIFLFQISSVRSHDRWGRPGDTTDDSAEILFQSFQQEDIVSSSDMGMGVHSLMLSTEHFLCRPRRRSPFKVP